MVSLFLIHPRTPLDQSRCCVEYGETLIDGSTELRHSHGIGAKGGKVGKKHMAAIRTW